MSLLINHQVNLSGRIHSIEDESTGDEETRPDQMSGSSQGVPDPSASLEASHQAGHPSDIEDGTSSGSVSQVEKRRIHSIEDESTGYEETRPVKTRRIHSIKDLDEYCLEKIFTELEFEDLMKAELICTAWKRIIDNR